MTSSSEPGRPLVLVDTAPQPRDRIFSSRTWDLLCRDFETHDVASDPSWRDPMNWSIRYESASWV